MLPISKPYHLCSCIVPCQVFHMGGETKPSIYWYMIPYIGYRILLLILYKNPCFSSYKKQRNSIKDLKRPGIWYEMTGCSNSCFHDYTDLKFLARLFVQRGLISSDAKCYNDSMCTSKIEGLSHTVQYDFLQWWNCSTWGCPVREPLATCAYGATEMCDWGSEFHCI